MTERELLEQFRNTPEGQKLLQAIRFAEGTAGPRGYQTMFGGGTFGDLSKHPDTVISSGGYKSAAAGAYQFMPRTWQSYAGRLGLQTFGPKEQDLAALALARDKLMSIGGLAALKAEGLSPRVSAALSPAWASFPTLSGKSYHGQPVKKLEDIQRVYGAAPTAPMDAVANTSVAVSPVSLPRFDFKGALKNIIGDFAQKSLSGSTTDDKSIQYLELANALDIEGNEELANEYRNKALEAAGETPQVAADPLNVLQQIITAKQNEKMYNARVEALEQQINQSMGAQSTPAGTLSAAPGAKIPGVQIGVHVGRIYGRFRKQVAHVVEPCQMFRSECVGFAHACPHIEILVIIFNLCNILANLVVCSHFKLCTLGVYQFAHVAVVNVAGAVLAFESRVKHAPLGARKHRFTARYSMCIGHFILDNKTIY